MKSKPGLGAYIHITVAKEIDLEMKPTALPTILAATACYLLKSEQSGFPARALPTREQHKVKESRTYLVIGGPNPPMNSILKITFNSIQGLCVPGISHLESRYEIDLTIIQRMFGLLRGRLLQHPRALPVCIDRELPPRP